jgi:hypothetical protein
MYFSGLQLGYTVIFGSYASFLFIRTGKSCDLIIVKILKLIFAFYMIA